MQGSRSNYRERKENPDDPGLEITVYKREPSYFLPGN